MHYFVLLAIPPGMKPTNELIAELMEPYDENRQVEQVVEDGEVYWRNPNALWDWYSVGGRWTGHLAPDYDPHLDPNNIETCDLCGGTGTRPDGIARFGEEWAKGCGGCNGCSGKGMRVKWPTDWRPFSGDVARLGDVRARLNEARPYAVVGPEIMVKSERYNPGGRWPNRDAGEEYDDVPNEERVFIPTPELVVEAINSLNDDCTVVVIDCHI